MATHNDIISASEKENQSNFIQIINSEQWRKKNDTSVLRFEYVKEHFKCLKCIKTIDK